MRGFKSTRMILWGDVRRMGRLGAHLIGWGYWAWLRAPARNQANQGVCIYVPALFCGKRTGNREREGEIQRDPHKRSPVAERWTRGLSRTLLIYSLKPLFCLALDLNKQAPSEGRRTVVFARSLTCYSIFLRYMVPANAHLSKLSVLRVRRGRSHGLTSVWRLCIITVVLFYWRFAANSV